MRKAIKTAAALFLLLSTVFLTKSPAGDAKVWTCDAVTDEIDRNAVKELKPLRLVGARNGTFSGKVVIESNTAITGISASAGALSGKTGSIPVSNIQIRYGKDWSVRGMGEKRDILLEKPEDCPPVSGRAFAVVWVTVNIPRDAKAGNYTGEVKVKAAGVDQKYVKVSLEVSDWALPEPQDYRTFMDFIQSPDTLALEYKVPLWSEKHWKLIERAFKLLSSTGSRIVYVPLICRTNLGNEQSMVRWIKKGENRYDHDYSIMDRYIDTAVANLGKPKIVVFQVWDLCMSSNEKWIIGRGNSFDPEIQKAITENRKALLNKGPRVSSLDPVTNETGMLTLTRYEDPASKALWAPLFAGVIEHMKKRGLEKAIMLGLMNDIQPNKTEVTFWNEVSKNAPWVSHGHVGAKDDVVIGNKGLYKLADIGYAAFVAGLTYNVNIEKGRKYGWQNPGIMAAYVRGGARNQLQPAEIRELPAFDITGGALRGEGRIGADYWPVLNNKKGERSAPVYSRYPENNWRNLDILDFFLAPGPEMVVSTAHLEYLKEGTQVCEARIFLEDALLDSSKKVKLGAELAKKCQDALDEHHKAMWKIVWDSEESIKNFGQVSGGRFPAESLWGELYKTGARKAGFFDKDARTELMEEAKKGKAKFIVGWQEREKKIFDLAGEAYTKLNSK